MGFPVTLGWVLAIFGDFDIFRDLWWGGVLTFLDFFAFLLKNGQKTVEKLQKIGGVELEGFRALLAAKRWLSVFRGVIKEEFVSKIAQIG